MKSKIFLGRITIFSESHSYKKFSTTYATSEKKLPSPDLTRSSQFSFVLHLLRHNTWLGNCAHAYVASIYGAVAMSQANRPVVMAPEAKNRVERWRWFVDGWQDMKKVDFIELKWWSLRILNARMLQFMRFKRYHCQISWLEADREIFPLPPQPCQDLWAGTHSFEDRYRKFMDHGKLTGSYWSPGINSWRLRIVRCHWSLHGNFTKLLLLYPLKVYQFFFRYVFGNDKSRTSWRFGLDVNHPIPAKSP